MFIVLLIFYISICQTLLNGIDIPACLNCVRHFISRLRCLISRFCHLFCRLVSLFTKIIHNLRQFTLIFIFSCCLIKRIFSSLFRSLWLVLLCSLGNLFCSLLCLI